MRLLVIEDELPMRTALVETLAAEGYRELRQRGRDMPVRLLAGRNSSMSSGATTPTPGLRTIDNFITGLRAKLEADPAHPRHLLTVRGMGYRLDP